MMTRASSDRGRDLGQDLVQEEAMTMRSRWRSLRLALAACAALLAVGASGVAQADDCDDQQAESQKPGKKNYRTVVGPDGRKVFVIEKAFVVCGRVPKPNVIYVLQASNINYEWETLKQEFLPKVLESVRKAPF
jgi:hypothetical protein